MTNRILLPLLGLAGLTACITGNSPQTPVASAVPVSSSAPEIGRDLHATAATNGGAVMLTTSGKPSQSGSLDPYPTAPARAVKVSEKGFEPASITAHLGQPMALVFTRTTEKTCATEVIFPWLGDLEANLPLGQPVRVSFKPAKSGDLKFACGMHMVVGKIVVLDK